PNEVRAEIRKRRIPTIAGNYDFGIGRNSDECGCAYKTEEEKANGAVSISLTNELISDRNRDYLRNLPAHIRVEYQLKEEKLNLLLVHGSPRKINEYLFEDRAEKSLLRIMEDAEADIMCFGHTHKPYHRILNSGDEQNPYHRHAINLGSIGKPKDGDPRGCYVLLEINESASVSKKESIKPQFIRFDYPVEK
ncbi:metallophosphoesterase family protein, partial [Pseudomonas sp. AMR01]